MRCQARDVDELSEESQSPRPRSCRSKRKSPRCFQSPSAQMDECTVADEDDDCGADSVVKGVGGCAVCHRAIFVITVIHFFPVQLHCY